MLTSKISVGQRPSMHAGTCRVVPAVTTCPHQQSYADSRCCQLFKRSVKPTVSRSGFARCASLIGGSDVVGDYTRTLTKDVGWMLCCLVGATRTVNSIYSLWYVLSAAASDARVLAVEFTISTLLGLCWVANQQRSWVSCVLQIRDLAEQLKDFTPEKAYEVLSQEEQQQIKEYINRCASSTGSAAWVRCGSQFVHTVCRTPCAQSTGPLQRCSPYSIGYHM